MMVSNRDDKNGTQTQDTGQESGLYACGFGDRLLAYKNARQKDDDHHCDEQNPRPVAPRFENGIPGNGENPRT